MRRGGLLRRIGETQLWVSLRNGSAYTLKKKSSYAADATRWILEQVRDDGDTGSGTANKNVRQIPPSYRNHPA
jgi:hypothetical protein